LMKISATEARNRFFELIQIVAYKNSSVIIKRNNKELVKIVALGKPMTAFISLDELEKETFAMVPKGTWPYEEKDLVKQEKERNNNWDK